MRVLHQDRGTGEIKMMIETLDDLWHLYNIIDEGDMIISVTYRREEAKSDKIRAERAEKKRMVLGVRAEKIEFHETESRLRILGVIEEGPQDIGSYHTLNLAEGDVVTVRKTHWSPVKLERVRRSVEDARRPRLLFVSLDNDEATIAIARQFGMQEIARICTSGSGKMYEQKCSDDYYQEIVDKVRQLAEPGVPLVVLGPGFAKEALVNLGKSKEPELFGKAFVYHTGQTGMAGIHELMKSGIGSETVQGSRAAQETKAVEEALERIAKDGLVAYGLGDVRNAAMAGAVDTLLVLDTEVRKGGVEEVMETVENNRGSVMVISERFEAGKKLEAIGGMVALLRYKLS
ncbi:MAG: mRNA surveillance protein pelota [Methanomassiliicoccaceae archaeon]|jgi:protein pelota|nr:mRNA surveillance protein pelota [Euryarchaeota archaeon]HOB38575.1 mRNA surveillance protein pelota [Methanomassiliicoccaceae archaeon]HQA20274.1 mRNA surveillance protein pelota [Methanomassiliicoccaceae archaeon]HQD87303.1 mRNA surveillance protein pelota [Methanomassiliicoccaceae archaeon]